MKRDMFNAQEIIARGHTLGDLGCDLCCALTRPSQATGGDVGPLGEDLEPDGAVPIPGGRRLAGWDLGHVELQCARVGYGRVCREANG